MRNPMLVFVCTGNICRSPMAEYLMRARLGPDSPWRVSSTGVIAAGGMPMSPAAVTVLKRRGIDGSGHLSQPLVPDLAEAASLLVVMASEHRAAVMRQYPFAAEKTFLLRSFDPDQSSSDVNDPIGCPESVYEETCRVIESCLPDLVAFMQQLRGSER